MDSNFDYIFIKIYIKVLAGLTSLCYIKNFPFFFLSAHAISRSSRMELNQHLDKQKRRKYEYCLLLIILFLSVTNFCSHSSILQIVFFSPPLFI